MKKLLPLCLLALASAQTKTDFPSAASTNESQTIEIIRNGSHSATKGPAQNFTGSVQVDQLFLAKDPSRVSGGVVTFEPGARSAWHTHPLGQILIGRLPSSEYAPPEPDQAFKWLDRAYVQHDSGVAETKVSSLVKSLHGDPRYIACLKKLRLPL
jgi:hypothetical protein